MSDPQLLTVVETPDAVVVEAVTPGPVGPEGPEGPEGPPGPAGGATYEHVQGTPASEWTIAHGLDAYPAVMVIDSTGNLVVGEVDYPDRDTVVLSFGGEMSGTASLR